MPGQMGYIIIHGTSQDIMSIDETTVKLAKSLEGSGEHVIQLGGPGSTERTIKRLKSLPSSISPSSWEDASPLDYPIDMFAGVAFGAGIDDIVEDGMKAMEELCNRGVQMIRIIGFSRGAVSAAMLTLKWSTWAKRKNIPLELGLLDPVPGPMLVPKHLVIPDIVKKAVLVYSQDEGRPFFGHLMLSRQSSSTRIVADLVRGVHGDIGGSTRSQVVPLSFDFLAQGLDLPYGKLALNKKVDLILDCIEKKEGLSGRGITQSITKRNFEWQGIPTSYSDGLCFPSENGLDVLCRSSPGLGYFLSKMLASQDMDPKIFERMRLEQDRNLRRMMQIMEREAEKAKQMQYMKIYKPKRPMPDKVGTIVFPPPQIQVVSTDKMLKSINLMKNIMKWLPK